MFLDKMPNIFFNSWLWIGIAAVLIGIHHFLRKSLPPPNKSVFFEKHKRAINHTTDIFLIFVILFGWILLIYKSVSPGVKLMLKGTHIPTNELIMDSVGVLAIVATIISGISGGLIGLLSAFQSNLTKRKRLILFFVSILPACFTIMSLMAHRFDEPGTIWLTLKLGFWASVFCWFINGSAIITGHRFIRNAWLLMRKLKLVSGEFPG
jgi:hypothetical protein